MIRQNGNGCLGTQTYTGLSVRKPHLRITDSDSYIAGRPHFKTDNGCICNPCECYYIKTTYSERLVLDKLRVS